MCYLKAKWYQMVPLWGIPVLLLYAMRRVSCQQCERVVVERVPWAEGKSPMTTVFLVFLASWARVTTWKEVGTRFHVRGCEETPSVGHDQARWRLLRQTLLAIPPVSLSCVFLASIQRPRPSPRSGVSSHPLSWDTLYCAVDWVVAYGKANRNLDHITAIGVDEIQRSHGQRYIEPVPNPQFFKSHIPAVEA